MESDKDIIYKRFLSSKLKMFRHHMRQEHQRTNHATSCKTVGNTYIIYTQLHAHNTPVLQEVCTAGPQWEGEQAHFKNRCQEMNNMKAALPIRTSINEQGNVTTASLKIEPQRTGCEQAHHHHRRRVETFEERLKSFQMWQ